MSKGKDIYDRRKALEAQAALDEAEARAIRAKRELTEAQDADFLVGSIIAFFKGEAQLRVSETRGVGWKIKFERSDI